MLITFDEFKKNAPGFKLIFGLVKLLIETDGPTDKFLEVCVSNMASEIRLKTENADSKVKSFLNLPASAFYSCVCRRPFLEELITRALVQALDSSKGNSTFNVSVGKDILSKKEFAFLIKDGKPDGKAIDQFGEKIQKFIPEIGMASINLGVNSDEIHFAIGYNFGPKENDLCLSKN